MKSEGRKVLYPRPADENVSGEGKNCKGVFLAFSTYMDKPVAIIERPDGSMTVCYVLDIQFLDSPPPYREYEGVRT